METANLIDQYIDKIIKSDSDLEFNLVKEEVEKVYPDNWAIMNHFGINLSECGQNKKARYFFMKSVKINPFHKDAYFNLGIISLNDGNIKEALYWFIYVKCVDPSDQAAKDIILKIYNLIGKKGSPEKKKTGPKKITTIIEFSSLDDPFIDACIDNAILGSDHVVAAAFNKFYLGEDDTPGIQKIIDRNKHKSLEFMIFDLPEINSKYTSIYHNLTRVLAYKKIVQKSDYTIFIDGDEIADGEILNRVRQTIPDELIQARFYNYWYFREPIYQSVETEYSPIIVKNEFLDFLFEHGLEQISSQIYDRDFYMFTDTFITPVMFHHYSWVRTKEQMLDKVKNWGHKNDKDWVKLVEEEFSREFSGTDFVHGYQYNIVPNKFNIKL